MDTSLDHWKNPMGLMGLVWMFPKIVVPPNHILVGFSIINHPFWGTPVLGNTRMFTYQFT